MSRASPEENPVGGADGTIGMLDVATVVDALKDIDYPFAGPGTAGVRGGTVVLPREQHKIGSGTIRQRAGRFLAGAARKTARKNAALPAIVYGAPRLLPKLFP